MRRATGSEVAGFDAAVLGWREQRCRAGFGAAGGTDGGGRTGAAWSCCDGGQRLISSRCDQDEEMVAGAGWVQRWGTMV
ncbi:hypothetical protein M0R45_036236 [Rubus argutus]|uniref:Uncharacterized protein n=1 Tax=Rubus argutus TaxID=59490 RepID=A0AAW1VVH9_RUBAR